MIVYFCLSVSGQSSELIQIIFFIAAVPFGFMPVLEVDGVQIGQTIAINSFLARKTGLTGANDVEYAQAEAIVDYIKDFLSGKGLYMTS